MRSFGKWLGRILLVLILGIAALFTFGPREPADVVARFDPAVIGDDPAAYFAQQEATFDDITPGTEKRIIWAGGDGVKTAQSVVFIHGYSATSEEIRPVPDMVADHLGANLVYTRLRGHGRADAVMAEATVQDWYDDLAEALAVAGMVGEEVIVISNSTGGTLVALAETGDPELVDQVTASVWLSPNFGVNSFAAPLLSQGGARWYLPYLIGETRSFDVQSEDHATYWTNSYPSVALLPMAAAVKEAAGRDYSNARTPALWIFSDGDRVIDHRETRRVAGEWGAISTIAQQDVPDGNDPYEHVIAGRVMSPGMTEPVVQQIATWLDGLE